MGIWIILFVSFVIICVASYFAFDQYKRMVQEAKNYERGLKDGSDSNSFATTE